MAQRLDIQLRFYDTDAQGHLNNSAFAHYAELARIEFFRALGIEVGRLILAHLALDFRRQVRFGDAVAVLTEVETVGTSSVTLRQTVLAGEETAADIRSVVVYFDYAGNRSRPLPEDVRRRLTA